MTLTLVLLALSAGFLAYGLLLRLPLPAVPAAPAVPPKPLTPTEGWLDRELGLGQNGLSVRLFLLGTAICASLGALVAWPLQNTLLTAIAACVVGSAPYQYARGRARQRSRAIGLAMESALVQIAQIAEVRHHPFLALADAVPMLEPPLKTELSRALLESEAGLPLPDALRRMATRCGENFYLHQLTELVALSIRDGGDLSDALRRLAQRLRTVEELRAEEAAELFGYRWLTRLLFMATVAPLPYWLVTRSPSLALFVHEPVPRFGLVWVVVSGLAIMSLPYWLAIDE